MHICALCLVLFVLYMVEYCMPRGGWCGDLNIIKNQERVIEQLMFDMLNIKIDIEEVDEVGEVVI